MGSTGDSPVPVGDPPTGRARRPLRRAPSLLAPAAFHVPRGESPSKHPSSTPGGPSKPESAD